MTEAVETSVSGGEGLALPDPQQSAERAGLVYVSDTEPGIRRRRSGRGFRYVGPDGQTVRDPDARARIGKMVIPPAWTDVWICADPDGHLQATGRDEKGRKQYVYHPEWERVRGETKFTRMALFGRALPAIRERCAADLRRRNLSREKVLATVTTLLDRTLIRVGNDEYARQNGTFGLTTLRDRHVDFEGSTCTFSFKGKSGKKHSIALDDARLARVIRHCRDIPGYELFQYYDEEGARHPVGSADVNAYLREATGQEFTAKDFRTWGGTVLAASVLGRCDACTTVREAERAISATIRETSARLGNTPSVCRAYYVHPHILKAFLDGGFQEAWAEAMTGDPIPYLDAEEAALLRVLEKLTDA